MSNEFEVGKRGEQLVKAALMRKGHEVIDMTADYDYRHMDIDFILKRGEQITTLEVKNDVKSNSSNNFYIETYNRNNWKSRPNCEGWYYYCEAQYIAFVQEWNKVAYVVEMDKLKAFINQGIYGECCGEFSRGYRVPVQKIAEISCYTIKL